MKSFMFFLNKVVEIVLEKYGIQLNLETLEEIELVDKNEYEYITDGRVIDCHKIIVTSRLYELLPSFRIEELNNNTNFKELKQTLYHEMGHINDMILMPVLYKYGFREDDSRERIVSQFWLEYIAERRSAGFEDIENFDLCNNFIKQSWKCTMCSFDSNFDSFNFAYLIKCLPYFMAATRENKVRNYYLKQIKNELLINFMNALDEEIVKLESKKLFDNVVELYDLYNIMNRFYKKFMATFRD